MSKHTPLVATLVTAAALGAVMAARQVSGQTTPGKPVAQFTTRVDLITLDVSVLDSERRPVRGLTAADFTILEDGVRQDIQAFSAIDVPDVERASAPWTREVQPDVTRNDDLAGRRIIAIVLDDALPMSVGYGTGNPIAYVKQAATEVVHQLGPRDLAAVIFPLDKGSGQDFTNDRARLLRAIDRYNGSTGFGAADGTGMRATRSQYLYQSLLSTVRVLTEYLAQLPDQRKALILASEGIPLDIDEMMPQIVLGGGAGASSWPQVLAELHDTFVAAQRANVNIYPIDPGGLQVNPSNPKVDFLKSLANATGGYAVVDRNDTAAGIQQIFRENGSYYLLGFAPSGPRREGRFRKIQVAVTRPNLTVRARSGYIEPPKAKAARKPEPAPVWAALASVMPRGDVEMHAVAAPFAAAGRRAAAVAIVASLHQPAPPGTDRVVEHADLLVQAYDPKGDRRAGERMTVRVVLRPEREGDVVYEVFSRLDLPPGRYQLRLAASSALQGKSGSLFFDLDVPDFTGQALSWSGVVVSAASGPTSAGKEKLAALLPVLPTTRREFTAEDAVTVFARLYQGGRNALAPVTVRTRIEDDTGVTVSDTTDLLEAGRFDAGRSAEYRIALPLDKLVAGLYLLTIDAQAGKAVARRTVTFSVR